MHQLWDPHPTVSFPGPKAPFTGGTSKVPPHIQMRKDISTCSAPAEVESEPTPNSDNLLLKPYPAHLNNPRGCESWVVFRNETA